MPVNEICNCDVVIAKRGDTILEAAQLAGILALDDLLELLADELSFLAKLVKHEQKKETMNRR